MKNYLKKTHMWWNRHSSKTWVYIQDYGYGRSTMRVQSERRQFQVVDEDEKILGVKPRAGRSPHLLNPWDIEPRNSRSFGRSWKDYTKARKQYDAKYPMSIEDKPEKKFRLTRYNVLS